MVIVRVGCHLKIRSLDQNNTIFFLYQGFSFTGTDDSQDKEKRGDHLFSFLLLPRAHKHSDIYLYFACEFIYLLTLLYVDKKKKVKVAY